MTSAELTVEKFGDYLPKEFAGHRLIPSLSWVRAREVIYPELSRSWMFLYEDPDNPDAPTVPAFGNVSAVPPRFSLTNFFADLRDFCVNGSGCTLLQENVPEAEQLIYLLYSFAIEDSSDPVYVLAWAELHGSLVYTLGAIGQFAFEKVACGLVNNALGMTRTGLRLA